MSYEKADPTMTVGRKEESGRSSGQSMIATAEAEELIKRLMRTSRPQREFPRSRMVEVKNAGRQYTAEILRLHNGKFRISYNRVSNGGMVTKVEVEISILETVGLVNTKHKPGVEWVTVSTWTGDLFYNVASLSQALNSMGFIVRTNS